MQRRYSDVPCMIIGAGDATPSRLADDHLITLLDA